MRKSHLLVSTLAVIIFATAGPVYAAACDGFSARKYDESQPVFKGKDKTMVLHVKSTGTTTRNASAGSKQNTSWQHCTGLWKLNPDKSGGGSGNCYSVDADGDYRIISWEGANAKGKRPSGTFARVSGTGKYEKGGQIKGTWKSGSRFADGHRISFWSGECAD